MTFDMTVKFLLTTQPALKSRDINVTYRQVVCGCFLMSLSKLKSQENGHLPYCLTKTVNVEE